MVAVRHKHAHNGDDTKTPKSIHVLLLRTTTMMLCCWVGESGLRLETLFDLESSITLPQTALNPGPRTRRLGRLALSQERNSYVCRW